MFGEEGIVVYGVVILFGRGDEVFRRNGLKRMKVRETILLRLHKVSFVFAHSIKLCWLHE